MHVSQNIEGIEYFVSNLGEIVYPEELATFAGFIDRAYRIDGFRVWAKSWISRKTGLCMRVGLGANGNSIVWEA